MMIQDALSNYDLPLVRSYQRHVKKPDLSHIPGNAGLPWAGHAIYMLILCASSCMDKRKPRANMYVMRSFWISDSLLPVQHPATLQPPSL